MSHGSDGSFEEALRRLQRYLGVEVAITIGEAEADEPGLIAAFKGVLRAGDPLSSAAYRNPPSEVLFFSLVGDPGSGFFLSRAGFRSVRWLDEQETALALRLGDIEVTLEGEESD